jgi:hypothetical protein
MVQYAQQKRDAQQDIFRDNATLKLDEQTKSVVMLRHEQSIIYLYQN